MKSVDALALRQSLGKVLHALERGGDPVMVQKRNRPAAVLISLRDYQERFVDREADETRRQTAEKIKRLRFSRPLRSTTLEVLRKLRAEPR